jgi:hypothetical protein
MGTFGVDEIAAMCHQAHREYCILLGDYTNRGWEHSQEEVKDSLRAAITFHIDHPETTFQEIHGRWLADRLSQGWNHGRIKNPLTKEHPDLVSYNDLSTRAKFKDRLFMAIVRLMSET